MGRVASIFFSFTECEKNGRKSEPYAASSVLFYDMIKPERPVNLNLLLNFHYPLLNNILVLLSVQEGSGHDRKHGLVFSGKGSWDCGTNLLWTLKQILHSFAWIIVNTCKKQQPSSEGGSVP